MIKIFYPYVIQVIHKIYVHLFQILHY